MIKAEFVKKSPHQRHTNQTYTGSGDRNRGSGLRHPNGSYQEQRKHVDVTALLLAADLGILDKVEQCFAPLRIAPGLPVALVRQRDMLEPHQTSRAASYRNPLQLLQEGRMQPILQATDTFVGPKNLIETMGADWTALLEKSRTEGSFIVDYLPLTGNTLEATPVILQEPYSKHVVNCRAIVQSLRDHGIFSEPTTNRRYMILEAREVLMFPQRFQKSERRFT